MKWNIDFFITGGCAVIFTVINLIRTLRKRPAGWELLMFCSLVSGLFAASFEHRMINQWMKSCEVGEWAAVEDMVFRTTYALDWVIIAIFILNAIILCVNLRRRKSDK